jgi:hypothetical protein
MDPENFPRNEAIDRFGGSLVNVILGALILWVGQTTFRHAGMLASVDERFQSTGHQFDAIDGRHEMLRQQIADTETRTRSRFTREDAEKLSARIKELHENQAVLERQITERVTNLQLKVIALETNGDNHQEVAMLRSEVAQLRAHVTGQQSAAYYRAATSATTTVPQYLPPVTQNR